MPHYRKLYTKTVESLDINDMSSDFIRLMWVLLPLKCCREGRGMFSTSWLKSNIFPLRDDVTPEMIESAMQEFINLDMIFPYEVGRGKYFQIKHWFKYQGNTSKEAPSIYPAPIGSEVDSSPELVQSNSGVSQTNVEKYPYASASASVSASSLAPNEFDDIRNAVLTVTKLDPLTIEAQDDKRIEKLFQAGYNAGQVDKCYSPGGFWYEADWRGKKGQPPTVKDILTTIGAAVDWVPSAPPPSANGQQSKQDKAQTLLEIVGRWGRIRYKDALPELEAAGLVDIVKRVGWTNLCNSKPDQIQWMI